MRVISYGGGVQSTALIVLVAQGLIPPVDAALFSNVGDDSEHPATLAYVRDVAAPWANTRGVKVHELYRVGKDFEPRTLMNLLATENTPSIPVRLSNGAPAQRSCTNHFKVRVIEKWLRENGATKQAPADVLIGISTDEIQRVNTKQVNAYQTKLFPLIDLGLNRDACIGIITDVGLPVPPKSSCFFCPFKRVQQWQEMRRDEPELFAKSADLEDSINERRAARGKDSVYLTRLLIPLRDITEAQDMLPGFDSPDIDSCDEGVCWV